MKTGFSILLLTLIFIIGSVFAMELHSKSFTANAVISSQYTCDGSDISPQLSWSDVPAGTKSFALILDDPDAPAGTWTHWVLYNIPPNINKLDENIKQLPDNTKVGVNSWGKQEYGGPCPPSGQHRYFFKLYALDTMLDLNGSVDATALQKAMKGHVLAQAELKTLYR